MSLTSSLELEKAAVRLIANLSAAIAAYEKGVGEPENILILSQAILAIAQTQQIQRSR